jgi:polyhydroxybutyrate depolymerase
VPGGRAPPWASVPALRLTAGTVLPCADTSAVELVSLWHDGQDRPYHLHVPDGAGQRVALVVELHGRGIDPIRFDGLTGFRPLADEVGFVLALPAAVGEIWNDGRDPLRSTDDVAYLDAVIEDACRRCPVDPGQVYLVGMSNGAAMAGRFALERAERIAGIGQVAGTAAASIAVQDRPIRSLGLIQIHGSRDEIAPYVGGSRRALRARLLVHRSLGASIGVDEWARLWVEALGGAETPESEMLVPDTTRRTWRDADGKPTVIFYRVAGAGHTWPSSKIKLPRFLFGRTTTTFDATRTIWEFLETSRKP